MATPRPAQPPDPRRRALEYLWGQYKVWDETSETRRKALARWRPLVLLLGIAGGVLGALSTPNAVPWLDWSKPPGALGVVGGILLGLAAFFTSEMLSPERESQWVRARAAAEAFKRESFLLTAMAPPYDGPVTPTSLDRAKDILATLGDMHEESLPEAKRLERIPGCPLSVDGYLEARLKDQLNYYRDKAGRHKSAVQRIRGVTLTLGVAAVVLGYLGGAAGAWLAVITAVTSSLAAYLYARRLQYLVVSFLATARNLEALLAGWGTSGKTDADTAERNQLILDCETILSAENNSWISEWVKKDAAPAPAGAQGGGAGEGGTGT